MLFLRRPKRAFYDIYVTLTIRISQVTTKLLIFITLSRLSKPGKSIKKTHQKNIKFWWLKKEKIEFWHEKNRKNMY